jgi:hypothetical protein
MAGACTWLTGSPATMKTRVLPVMLDEAEFAAVFVMRELYLWQRINSTTP